MRNRRNRHFALFVDGHLLDDTANALGFARRLTHEPLDRLALHLLHLLDLAIFGRGRLRLGNMNGAAAYNCAASRTGGQFRKGHTNRHKRCSLSRSLNAVMVLVRHFSRRSYDANNAGSS